MSRYSLTHLSLGTLHQGALAIVARDRNNTADLLNHLAEIEARRGYAEFGYSSMHAYCVGALDLEGDEAYRRIHVARIARKYPVILEAIADRRLHLTSVLVMSTYLTPENAEGLLAGAARKSKSEIEQMLAARFPRTETLPMVTTVLAPTPPPTESPVPVVPASPERVSTPVRERIDLTQLVPERVMSSLPRVAPIATQRFEIRMSVGQSTHDKLRYLQELSGESDLATLLDQCLDARIHALEKKKFAATSEPHAPGKRVSTDPRYIPAHVKRAVKARDKGRCTFTSDDGHRCDSRRHLEFDHIVPVARGGTATISNIRLRCRTHNQYEAERALGRDFMASRRDDARRASRQGVSGVGRPL